MPQLDAAKIKSIADSVDELKGRMDSYAARRSDADEDHVLTFPKAAALAEKYKNENLQVAKQAMKLDGQSPANIARVVELINAIKSRGDADFPSSVKYEGKTYFATGKKGTNNATGEASQEYRYSGETKETKEDMRLWRTLSGKVTED